MKVETFEGLVEGVEFDIVEGVIFELQDFVSSIRNEIDVEYVSSSYGTEHHTVYIETNTKLSIKESNAFVLPLLKSIRYQHQCYYKVKEEELMITYEMLTFTENKWGFRCDVIVECPHYCAPLIIT